MQKRQLGKSDLRITPLVLGGNVFGWTADEKASFEVLDKFVDLGGDAIDTADMYSCWIPGNEGGESERMIGAWLKQSRKRDKVVIATKCGSFPKLRGLKRETMLQACDESLRRMGIARIDLYQIHRDDLITPPEDFLSTLAELQRAGKINVVGLSNFEPDRLEATVAASKKLGGPRIDTLQPLYNLMARGIEDKLQPICVREAISLIPFYALAEGYLSGKYRTEADKKKSARGAGMDKYMKGKGPAVLAALDDIGARHKATPAQVALAWVMAQPAVGGPIASATSAAQVEDILGAVRVSLSAGDLAQLDEASR